MRSLFLAILLGLTALLAGCAHDNEVIIRSVLKLPPDDLLQDCPVSAPPDKAQYKAMGDGVSREEAFDKREAALTKYGDKQTQNLATCSTDKKGLRDWKVKQQAIYEQEQKDAAAKSKKKE